ncbi:MAG: phosphatase PAP2 family protein [Pseudomonadota bacterium]
MRFSLVFLALALVVPASAGAGAVRETARHLAADYESLFTWESLGLAAGTVAAGLITNHSADDRAASPTRSPYFSTADKRLSDAGLYLSLAAPAGFLGVALILNSNSQARTVALQTGEEMVESLLFTIAAAGFLKLTIDRTRPDGGSQSFPSFHTAATFSAATTLAYRFPWFVGAPALGFATAVGFARADSKRHFVSDVVAGAGIGALFSTAVYLGHRRLASENAGQARWQITPVVSTENASVVASYFF